MRKTKLTELAETGQSAWLDYISRSLLTSDRLKELIQSGLRGMTSNPTIFDKAISGGEDYDDRIQELRQEGGSIFDIYDELTVRDIQDAADLFSGVYQKTRGLDGYVSLEVNPKLAYNAHRTVEEARRLYEKVNRPNLMLKVPATDEGFKAVSKLTSLGLNVNVTLIFSLEQYISTAQAYIEGISRLIEGGGQPGTVRSVASVFVSRIDSVVDKMLDKELKEHKDHKTIAELTSLKGTAAVANSQIIYGKFIEMFSDEKFTKLKKRGANSQRVLWGSTSTKNPIYSDVKYVTDLIGRDTVNTIPENTLLAFLDHGEVKEALTTGTSSAEDTIRDLKSFGIDVNRICMKLLEDGIASFEKSFDSLLETIEKKSERLQV